MSQHAEDTAFIWLLRDQAVRGPHFTLADLARLEGRLEAHLEGLQIARGAGAAACAENLSHPDAGEVFAAACLALETGRRSDLDRVFPIVASRPQTGRGLTGALAWVAAECAIPATRLLDGSGIPALQAAALAGRVSHGPGPDVDSFVETALHSDDPTLRARGFASAARLGHVHQMSRIEAGLDDQDPDGRFMAAWAGALLGGASESLPVLRSIATRGGSRAEEAAALAVRMMEPRAAEAWVRELGETSITRKPAIAAAGAAGDPSAVPWLLEQMHRPTSARLAGEAFSLLTGADLVTQHLDQPIARDDDRDSLDTGDGDPSLHPDHYLPWPDPQSVERWWNVHRDRFRAGVRHLLGEPISAASLRRALRTGRQRQRAAAALELKLQAPGEPLFDVRAPVTRQRRALTAN